jgi:hypothetical protein
MRPAALIGSATVAIGAGVAAFVVYLRLNNGKVSGPTDMVLL